LKRHRTIFLTPTIAFITLITFQAQATTPIDEGSAPLLSKIAIGNLASPPLTTQQLDSLKTPSDSSLQSHPLDAGAMEFSFLAGSLTAISIYWGLCGLVKAHFTNGEQPSIHLKKAFGVIGVIIGSVITACMFYGFSQTMNESNDVHSR
jgi:hypothetical protein